MFYSSSWMLILFATYFFWWDLEDIGIRKQCDLMAPFFDFLRVIFLLLATIDILWFIWWLLVFLRRVDVPLICHTISRKPNNDARNSVGKSTHIRHEKIWFPTGQWSSFNETSTFLYSVNFVHLRVTLPFLKVLCSLFRLSPPFCFTTDFLNFY